MSSTHSSASRAEAIAQPASAQTHPRHRRLPWNVLLGSVSVGLSGGLLEVAVLTVRARFLKEPLLLSPQYVWMVPVVTAVLAVGMGLFLLCISGMLSETLFPALAVFMLAWLGFLGPLLAIPQLHYLVAIGLAAGLAVLSARFAASRLHRCLTLAPRAALWTTVCVAGLAVGVNGWRILEEHRAVAQLPPARPNAPNVLLIVLDTVRAESLSLYGNPKPTTPELERWAPGGVVFKTALAASPWTLPSHATVFTGHWPHELSAGWREPLDDTYPTLAEVLRAHGYLTAGFVANLIYGSTFHGLNRGFIHYEDFPVSVGQALLSSSLVGGIATNDRLRYWFDYQRVLNRKTAATVNQEFLAWLSRKDERPFFAFLNYMDAHEPYLPPPPFERAFGPSRGRVKFWHTGIDAFRPAKWKMSPQEVQAESAAYEGVIAYIDQQIGALLAELQKRSLLDNTVVIIVSDHGEQLGEHRLFAHGNSLYRQLLQVPLLIYFRNHVPAGTVVDEPVTLRDIPATVIDLVGLENRPAFPGRSLARFWHQPAEAGGSDDGALLSEASKRVFGVQPWYPLSAGDMQSLVGDGYHYIKNEDGREELYDFTNDPAENQDLAGSDEGRHMVERFRQQLATILARTPNAHAAGAPVGRHPREIDAETRDRMRALGY